MNRIRQIRRWAASIAGGAAIWTAVTGCDQGLIGDDPIRLDSGLITGELLDAESSLRVYRGIPYAAAPVGDLRWRPPERVAPWQGVRSATEFGAICTQPARQGA